MPHVRILAVEDDPIHAESLEMLVREMNYELVKLTDNADEALASVSELSPDLMLLDIEINGSMTGVELAARLKNVSDAPVIFVTSHKDKATFQQAKLTSPNAFIIKPYGKESLQAAIELALLNRNGHGNAPREEESFYVKDKGSLFKISPLEIVYIEADEKYCTIRTRKRNYTLNIRLKELHDRLSSHAFIQTHRGFLVRKDSIEKINVADQTLTVNGEEIPIGKSFKEQLFGKLKLL